MKTYQNNTCPNDTPEAMSWMEMVAVNLVREGVNKHKARELARHFYNQYPRRKGEKR